MTYTPKTVRGYHGTSLPRAEAILQEGFRTDRHRNNRSEIHFGSRLGLELAVGMAMGRSISDNVVSIQESELGIMVPVIVADLPLEIIANDTIPEHFTVPYEHSPLIVVRGIIEVSTAIPVIEVQDYFLRMEAASECLRISALQ